MGNRVEDLEAQVAELQAAVDGLTEELVEAKERISQLEQTTDVRAEPKEQHTPNAEFVPNESATTDAAETNGAAGGDAENTAQAEARGGDEESPAESESSDDDTDDIIVA